MRPEQLSVDDFIEEIGLFKWFNIYFLAINFEIFDCIAFVASN